MGIALHIHNLRTLGGWSIPHPQPLYPRKEISFPLYRWLGEPQNQSGLAWKNLTPLWGSNQGGSSIRVVAPHARNLRKIKYLNKGSR